MNVTEATLQSWAAAPGITEQTRCDNAVTAIKKAVGSSSALSNRNIQVFAQGSYRNRTNVPQDSDVDVCVLCTDTFYYDLPDNTNANTFGIAPGTYSYDDYKNQLGEALRVYFGKGAVNRGKKAFNIRENSYRVDADAIACFEYRLYDNSSGARRDGVCFFPDGVYQHTQNYPQQNYDNGVRKNQAATKFKDVVRILKSLRYKMKDAKLSAADPIPSFLVESLVWNAPNSTFAYSSYSNAVRDVLAHLFNNTRNANDCSEWTEVNDVKYLFRPSQGWTMAQAHTFISAAWDYIGYE